VIGTSDVVSVPNGFESGVTPAAPVQVIVPQDQPTAAVTVPSSQGTSDLDYILQILGLSSGATGPAPPSARRACATSG